MLRISLGRATRCVSGIGRQEPEDEEGYEEQHRDVDHGLKNLAAGTSNLSYWGSGHGSGRSNHGGGGKRADHLWTRAGVLSRKYFYISAETTRAPGLTTP